MSRKKLSDMLVWLHDLCILLLIYLLAAGFWDAAVQDWKRSVLQGIALLIPLVVSEWGIRHIKNILGYLMLSVLFTAGTWWLFRHILTVEGTAVIALNGAGEFVLTTGLAESLLTTVLTGAIFLIRATAQIKRGQIQKQLEEMPGARGEKVYVAIEDVPTLLDVPQVSQLSVFVIVYAIQIQAGHRQQLSWTVFLLAADIVIYLLYFFLERRNEFEQLQSERADFPGKTLRRMSNLVLLPMFLLLAVAVVPVLMTKEEPLRAVSLESKEPKEEPERLQDKEMQGTDTTQDTSGMAELLAEKYETPVWLTLLYRILEKALIFLAAVGAVWLMIRILRTIARYYAAEEEDQIEYFSKGRMAENETLMKRKKEKEPFFGEKMRIRRQYKRLIRKHLKEKINGSETPAELEQKAGLNIAELHREYEKARYETR